MLLYGPPEPPPDTIDFDNPAHCEHIYIHPFDYDPIRVTDITFDDFLPSMDSVYNTNPKSEVIHPTLPFLLILHSHFTHPPPFYFTSLSRNQN